MNPLYIRRISVGVAVAGLLVPHWVPLLRGPLDTPLTFTVGLLIGIALLTAHGLRQRPPAETHTP